MMLRRVVAEASPLVNSLREGLLTSSVNAAGVTTVSKRHNHRIGVLGIPFNKGQRKPGVSKGPDSLRNAGLVQTLLDLGLDVADYGDVMYSPCPDLHNPVHLRNLDDLAPCMYEVSMKSRAIQSEGRLCLSIGGDHSMALGTVDATLASHKDVAVLWVDAHSDINTPCTSNSGSVHGMSISKLSVELNQYWPNLGGMDWLVPKLQLRNLAYIGLRDVEESERFFLEKFGVTAFSASDVQYLGVTEVLRRALKAIDPNNEKAIHLSLDIDSLDPLEAPSTGTPVRGGLSLREGICLMEEIHQTGRLVAMDLAEFNPTVGSPEQVGITASACLHMIRSAVGYRQLGCLKGTTDLDLPVQTRSEPVAMRSQ